MSAQASQTLFIADLHLDSERPDITARFTAFIERLRREGRTEALYIIGDLFEVWIGDDDDSPLAQLVADALSAASRDGIALYFIAGNRDFLLGEVYANACAMQRLADEVVVDLYGRPTLLMHGDTLCSDDVDYQRFRALVRDSNWQAQTLALPLIQRRQLAARLRGDSQAAGRLKPSDIMDINASTLAQAMARHGVSQLIHGHTHRPGAFAVARNVRRWVVGDWETQANAVIADVAGVRWQTFADGEM